MVYLVFYFVCLSVCVVGIMEWCFFLKVISIIVNGEIVFVLSVY